MIHTLVAGILWKYKKNGTKILRNPNYFESEFYGVPIYFVIPNRLGFFFRIRWLKREGGGNEIESFLKKAPFENYPLFLGAMKLKSGIRMFRQMQRRKVRRTKPPTSVKKYFMRVRANLTSLRL